MLKNKENIFNTISTILVIGLICFSLWISIVSYIVGDPNLGHVSLGVFIVSALLYWFFIRDYLSNQKKKNKNTRLPAPIRFVHILVIITFLLGPLLWASINYWVGEYSTGHTSIGVFAFWSIMYWFFGVDYFKVDWLLKLKHGTDKK